MADDKLPRHHADHDVVKFFYGAIRQLPEFYVDALLHWGVSVTMVKSPDLIHPAAFAAAERLGQRTRP
ncbi:MAG: hypothetical protein VX792_02735 [Candidatus Latescibacterota bacterium]|nr:hypothetical protein [Candidatus Latescibacterota bacterium]